ncbi:unnamed protein product [Sphagnum balticum]
MAELSHHTGNGLEDLYAILKARDVMVEQLRLDLTCAPSNINVRIILDGQRDVTEFHIPPHESRAVYKDLKDLMQAVGESTNVKYIWMLCQLNFWAHFCVQLCLALCVNHTMSALRFELSGIGSSRSQSDFDTILTQVGVMITRNKGLKYFACKYSDLRHFLSNRTFWCLEGAAAALKRNRTLEHLEMGGIDVRSARGLIQGLIQPLTADANGRQSNSTLVKLDLTLRKQVNGNLLKLL